MALLKGQLVWKTERKERMLIEEDVAVDTHKLFFTEEFYAGIDNGGGTKERSLRGFFDRRQAFLLVHEEVQAAKTIEP